MRSVLLIVVAALTCPGLASAQLWSLAPDGTRVAEPWTLAEGVSDPLFAMMVGVIDAGSFGEIHQAQIDSIVQANGGSKLPTEVFARMSRMPTDGGADALVEIQLTEAVNRPIPYSLLGYNPGSIRSSERIEFLHFELGHRHYRVGEDGEEIDIEIEDAQLFVVLDGFMEMDFDAWLDRLLGSKLDDMQVKAFLLFRTEGQRYSLGMGLTENGRGKTGAFDFLEDETLFPAPKSFLVVGRELRQEGLRRLERWKQLHSADPAARTTD
jgi:hypothetical protein